MSSPSSTTVQSQPSLEKLHITLSTESRLGIDSFSNNHRDTSPTDGIEIVNSDSSHEITDGIGEVTDSIEEMTDGIEEMTDEQTLSTLRDEIFMESHDSKSLAQFPSHLPKYAFSTPSTRSVSLSPINTQYLHTKMPYEAHPYRSNWATTSHVIEHLQGTIDSLKRELKEQVAKGNEEHRGSEVLNKRCNVSRNELEQLKLENKSLNDIIGSKEQRVKQLERDIEQKKLMVKDLENNQLDYIESKREYQNTIARMKEDQGRSDAAYDSVVSGIEMIERNYRWRFDQITTHLAELQASSQCDKNHITRLEEIILLQSRERDHFAALKAEIDEEHERHMSTLKILMTGITTEILNRNSNQTDVKLNETTKLVDELEKTYELLRTPL